MPVIRTAADLSRQMKRLDDAVKAFSESLRQLGSAVGGWRPRPIPPGTLSGILSSGQVLYDLLDLQFEDPNQAKALAKYVRRIKNLRKMVGKFKDARSDEELAEVYKSLSSKSKSAWQKFIEYRSEVLSLVGTLDTEPAGQFRLGGMSVALIRTGARGFTSEEIEKAKAVLTKAERYLQQRGLGELTGLTVFIYPTAGIPGRPSANAWYNRKDDTAAIAVGSAWFKKSSVDRMVQTMVHELGHRAYYRMMSNNGRRMWEAFYEEMQEPPDVNGMIRDWDAFVADAYDEKDRRRRSHFRGSEGWYSALNKQDREAATWLLMAVGNFNLDSGEKFDNRHGRPTTSSVPALDALKARKSEIKVFAEPVTAYSSTSAHELFAEAFAHYLAYGPRTLSPRLRGQFQMTLPKMKMASQHRMASRVVARYVHDKVDWHGQVEDLRGQVENLRVLRQGFRKQIGDIRRSVGALDKSLKGSPMYDDIRRGLYRAVQSLDTHDPRTTSFLSQLDELSREYDQIGMGLRLDSARRVASRHMRAGTRLYHLSPVEFSNFKQQELGGGYQSDIGFHFGTKETALTASDMLYRKGRIDKGDTVYLYELDIDTGKPLVLNENSRGSWSIHDLLRTIFEGGPGGGPVPAAGVTDEEWNAYYGQDDDGEELDEGEGVFLADGTNLKDSWLGAEEQRRGFLSWLKAHGFKSVKYKNTYEGGGDSFIVFDPKQIKIKSVTPYTYEG